jgi:hypothetical protein
MFETSASDKHSGLLLPFVNYSRISFIGLGLGNSNQYNEILSLILKPSKAKNIGTVILTIVSIQLAGIQIHVPDMFCNFYLVKSCKISNNSVTTEARQNLSTDLESLEF